MTKQEITLYDQLDVIRQLLAKAEQSMGSFLTSGISLDYLKEEMRQAQVLNEVYVTLRKQKEEANENDS